MNLWDSSKAAHTREVKCAQDQGFWGCNPLDVAEVLVFRVQARRRFPAAKGLGHDGIWLCPALLGFVQESLDSIIKSQLLRVRSCYLWEDLLLLVLVLLWQSQGSFYCT